MKDEKLRLLEFLFGEGAGRARRGASERLLRWGEAFEGWMGERGAAAQKQRALTWRRLAQERGKMPWEMTQEDIEAHLAWMEEKGLAATTRANAVGMMASFYRWCDERGVDAACGKGFNPAAGARRPKVERYAGAAVWSQGEVERLVGILRRDETALGKRDTAFFLMRLRMGAPLENLRRLKWGQIEAEEGQAWVRWREGGERVEMPGEVWEAMQEWMRASGREGFTTDYTDFTEKRGEELGMERFVFAPQVHPMQEGAWAEGRAVSSSALLGSLKVYGRRAGIEEGKLTLLALRRTAMRLKLAEGEGVEGMQRFMESREEAKSAKYRLKRLPEMADDPRGEREDAPEPPARKPRPFQAGEGLKHGMYAHSQPTEEVMAVLQEDIQGIEEEIAGVRQLARGLMEMQGRLRSGKEAAQMLDAYMLTASRLATIIQNEKELVKKDEEGEWVERFLDFLDRVKDEVNGPSREEAIAEALGSGAELTVGSRQMVEEMASTRLALRRVLALAREAEEKGEAGEYLRLTEIYSSGCNRLMKLLRTGKAERGRLEAYLKKGIQDALEEIGEEWVHPRY